MPKTPQAAVSIDRLLERRRELRQNWLLTSGVILLWSFVRLGNRFQHSQAAGACPRSTNWGGECCLRTWRFSPSWAAQQSKPFRWRCSALPSVFFLAPLGPSRRHQHHAEQVLGAAIRVLLNSLRTIPELLWAMLLVSAVGLGTFPGTIALILHTTGGLGKFYYEAIEAVDPGVIEAMEATGAGRFQVAWFGVLPKCFPILLSSTLTLLGLQQSGSDNPGSRWRGRIGLAFTHAIQDFQYPIAMTASLSSCSSSPSSIASAPP